MNSAECRPPLCPPLCPPPTLLAGPTLLTASTLLAGLTLLTASTLLAGPTPAYRPRTRPRVLPIG